MLDLESSFNLLCMYFYLISELFKYAEIQWWQARAISDLSAALLSDLMLHAYLDFFVWCFKADVAAWRTLLCFAIKHLVDIRWCFVVQTCTLVSSEDYQVIWFELDLSLCSSFYLWSYLFMQKLLTIAEMLECKETKGSDLVLPLSPLCVLHLYQIR
jgi:hypothetical protein